MFSRIVVAIAVVTFLSGCAVNQQKPMELAPTNQGLKNQKIGVAMTQLPKVEMQYPGAGCLLCLMAASATNSTLSHYAESLPQSDVLGMKAELAKALRKGGAEVIVIDEEIALKALPDTNSKGDGVSPKDFSSFKQKYNVDKLLVIEVQALGISRDYASYIPTGDPKSQLVGKGYLVNLATNAYEWYQPIHETKSSDDKWDEPPNYPGLTNAYFQTIELAKDDLTKAFAH